MDSIEAITLAESKRLIQLESTIERGLSTFVEVGEALLEIRDSRLYRIEHRTFEEYCRKKWGMSRRFAYFQIEGAKAALNVNNCSHVPATESQARPLTKLPPEKQPEAWNKAVEIAGGKQPTAKQVQQAVIEIMPQETKATTPPKDYYTHVEKILIETNRLTDTQRAELIEELQNIVATREIAKKLRDELRGINYNDWLKTDAAKERWESMLASLPSPFRKEILKTMKRGRWSIEGKWQLMADCLMYGRVGIKKRFAPIPEDAIDVL